MPIAPVLRFVSVEQPSMLEGMRGSCTSSALQRLPTILRSAAVGRRPSSRAALWRKNEVVGRSEGYGKSFAAAAAADSRSLEPQSSAASSASSSSLAAIQRVETGKPQLTLVNPVTRAGIGLHSGEIAELRLLPAAAGEGRYFVVGDSEEREIFRIPATLDYVRDTTLCTCLGRGDVSVRTVEHLLSALEGLGVDNCRIEIRNANEVPLLDGSALEWVEAIEAAGLSVAEDGVGSPLSRRALVLREPVSVWHGDSFVAAFPAPTTRLTYGIDFTQAQAIGRQWFTWLPDDGSAYLREIAPARTFGIFEQINQLQAAGLIKGGSLKNALVCSTEKGWLNPPLRFADEPCRHKLLDLIGDLALCAYEGHPGLPVAHVIAYKASHSLHVKFGEAILQAGVQ